MPARDDDCIQEERLTRIEAQLIAIDQRFLVVDEQLIELRRLTQGIPGELRTIVGEQTKDIQSMISIKVNTVGSQQAGLEARVRMLEERADRKDGLIA